MSDEGNRFLAFKRPAVFLSALKSEGKENEPVDVR